MHRQSAEPKKRRGHHHATPRAVLSRTGLAKATNQQTIQFSLNDGCGPTAVMGFPSLRQPPQWDSLSLALGKLKKRKNKKPSSNAIVNSHQRVGSRRDRIW